jgi:peptidoglycan/LPS O-acetylase OafA/YrhL
MRWQLRTKAVAALPGLATLALAGATAIADAGHGEDDSFPGMLVLTIELAAVVALVAISAWQPDIHGRGVLRLVVVLWGTTAFGVIHVIAEYAIMIKFSDANWDSPPGFGYLTVAVLTISAILTAIMTLRAPRKGADDEPHQDHHSGSLTLA